MRLHSIIISNLYTRFSNSTNYHLSLPRPRIDTFETSIAFTHTFFQLYELSPQFAQAKDRHIQNRYSLYIHVFPTLRTINLVCLGQGKTHSKQVQPLYTRFSTYANYHLSLPRPRIDTFKTSIAFTHTFFQLYELSPQIAQAKNRHIRDKYSLYTHFFPTSTKCQLSSSRPGIDTFKTSIAFTDTFFPTLRTITLVCLDQGQTQSEQAQPSLVPPYGTSSL